MSLALLDASSIPLATRRPLRSAGLIVLWGLTALVALERLGHARAEFADRPQTPEVERRADGHAGHTSIDFGGQYLMGRMLVTGHGRQLYHRQQQWPVAWESYPTRHESRLTRDLAFPKHRREPTHAGKVLQHDAEELMSFVMGQDAKVWNDAAAQVTLPLLAADPLTAFALTSHAAGSVTPELVHELNRPAIGGPLYPPVHTFVYAPLTLTNDPRAAYKFFQCLSLALTFSAGLAITRIARGRVAWPLATLAVLLFPGYRSGLDLGQNQVVTLNILLWGYVLVTRRRDGWAGVVWGLLAFKPVWAVAFLMVPLVSGRLRMLLTMSLTGGLAVAGTLPFVGVQAWFDWLAVGQEASAIYSVNENWITLSRDLAGVVRRFAVDMSLPVERRERPEWNVVCLLLVLAVAAVTSVVYWLRGSRGDPTGRAAAFLLLGAYLSCYRFMYYDAVLALLPLAVLFAQPRCALGPTYRLVPESRPANRRLSLSLNSTVVTLFALLYLIENGLMGLKLEGAISFGFLGGTPGALGGMPKDPPTLALNTTIRSATDTLILLAIWLNVGCKLLLGVGVADRCSDPAQGVEGRADVG